MEQGIPEKVLVLRPDQQIRNVILGIGCQFQQTAHFLMELMDFQQVVFIILIQILP